MFPQPDADIWWHLKTGEIILTQHTIPRADLLTFTAEGRPWVTHDWLSEVIYQSLYRVAGFDGLIIFKALLAALALALGAWAALAGPNARERLAPAALGVLLAAPLLATRAFIRPHMFTAVLLGATLVLLRLDETAKRRTYRLALVPVFLRLQQMNSRW